MNFFDKKDIDGVLYELLRSPWLQALLKVYECLHQYTKRRPVPFLSQAQELMHEVVELLHRGQQSPEMKELRQLLQGSHFKALLLAHDTVAQKDFEPMLPPLTENLPENEEAMRIVCLVKNNQPLGATIKRHELTGDITVARVIHGGLADKSALLYAGDKLVEVNGIPVEGLEPEQVIHILALSRSTIMFKLIPGSDRIISNQTTLYVRAMRDYCPRQDPLIPCVDAGLPFKKGEILQIVDQKDILWWQARKVSNLKACAGLIPSNHLMKRKQREFWWTHPFHPHSCLQSTNMNIAEEEDDMQIDEKCVETDEETFESEEEEFIGSGQPVFITGFRRSMRLCRRKCNYSHLACQSHCLNSCYGAVAAPYEEVVRYQREPGDRNRLIVLIGPSGVGVNELRRQLIGINPHLFRNAVPHTTRAQKSYEENGREYHYVPKETFENMVYNYRMLEYGEYKGHLYGTSIDAVHAVLDEGKICIVDLEPYSIQFVRTHELKPYIIFIKPPSVSCMKQTRKNARIITDYYVNMKFKEEDLQEMEESAKKMETQFGQFFDQVIVNDNLQEACLQLVSAVHQAQNEPQWVPATWICSGSQD
ncbi:MAGUK p55 subfamily member 4 isoform X2 [Pantherophis guttatus]|uniref:MAGUK p55 subfamily member 4 isoform X2 n=1 Tax=Pantherophis guttatus TaxID=94885 RepID=A0A6P9CQD7_PANGU|nr:MAGUK p55 subfamily member 4 isoform X2 [Pantherophis guttatus]